MLPQLKLSNQLPIVNDVAIEALLDAHPLFRSIHDRIGLPTNWYRPPGFVSLSRIILDQQVSLASAYAHYVKLDSYIPAFTPENIIKLSDVEMRTCQISRQKATYLRALSQAL